MSNYTVLAKFRNKKNVDYLVGEIKSKGFSCYNFCDTPADPNKLEADPEEQMKKFEKVKDFYNDDYYKHIFEKDLKALKEAERVVVLLPIGNSVHIEAGIAYGLGKEIILIGRVEKPESLYLIFQKRFDTIEDFLETI